MYALKDPVGDSYPRHPLAPREINSYAGYLSGEAIKLVHGFRLMISSSKVEVLRVCNLIHHHFPPSEVLFLYPPPTYAPKNPTFPPTHPASRKRIFFHERFFTAGTSRTVPKCRARSSRYRQEPSRTNFTGLVLGCIETKICKKVCVWKLSPRSTQCTPLHTSAISFLSKNCQFVFDMFFDLWKNTL